MLKRANINWNAKQLVKMMEKGTIKFDNAVQRGFVWDDKRNSLLIHSMIEGYPIPPFYAVKNADGFYDCLDGKQRSNAIQKFITGEYVLTELPEITLEDSSDVDITGKKFEELPEEVKDIILSYSLTVYYFEDITDDQINEMFARLNNGKPLSQIELTRVKAKSIDSIRELGKHDLFKVALTEKAINRYTNEDIVIKTWVMLTNDTPCLDTKVLRPITETAEFTAENMDIINKIFNMILDCYTTMTTDIEDKATVKAAKRLITRTHLYSVTPLVRDCIAQNVGSVKLSAFFAEFFSGKRGASNYDDYNANCSSGSGHEQSIKDRLDVITSAWKKFNTEDSVQSDDSIVTNVEDKTEVE